MKALIKLAQVESRIYTIRDNRVMLDQDLARLYGVPIKRLNEQVKRNMNRFPPDFMFQLSRDEFQILRSQFATLRFGWGEHRKYMPYVFTQDGVAMLSSVLNSPRAIHVNIQIMRAFTRLKGFLLSYEDIRKEIRTMRGEYDGKFSEVFDAIGRLFDGPKKKFKVKGFAALKKV